MVNLLHARIYRRPLRFSSARNDAYGKILRGRGYSAKHRRIWHVLAQGRFQMAQNIFLQLGRAQGQVVQGHIRSVRVLIASLKLLPLTSSEVRPALFGRRTSNRFHHTVSTVKAAPQESQQYCQNDTSKALCFADSFGIVSLPTAFALQGVANRKHLSDMTTY